MRVTSFAFIAEYPAISRITFTQFDATANEYVFRRFCVCKRVRRATQKFMIINSNLFLACTYLTGNKTRNALFDL